LAREITGHDVATVRSQQWLGLTNGVLLRAAVDAGFEVLVTADKALRFQQNLVRIGIAVVLVSRIRNRMQDLRPLLPRLHHAIASVKRGELLEVAG
jgi:hypothetical protein